MTIAYFDCPSGASGDMILAAFLDAGLPLDYLREQLALVNLAGYSLESSTVLKNGLTAASFKVNVQPQHHHRHWTDIRAMIEGSGLAGPIKDRAIKVFSKLAEAEGRVHGVAPDKVHFHEVGAIDSIIDIVGAAIAVEYFGVTRIMASPLPLGSGWIETAHGRLPLPAPATLALLEGVPTYGGGVEAELVTPTGAAFISALADGFGPRPSMTSTATGYGAGTRDLPDRPNVIRLTLGEAPARTAEEILIVAETNVDDMNPEIWPYLVERLLTAGALDAWMTPIYMKKGRPGVQLSFLAHSGDLERLAEITLAETTTLGLRTFEVNRRYLGREGAVIETPWGEAAVKIIARGEKTELVPEYEACRKIAVQTGLPLKDIYEEIKRLGRDWPAGKQ